ncbi:MAG: heparinase II/III family protein [Verrucomicrobia bacterium]|nr:heparinase II/III family protein [Verrucomicrobiota bacterium]
MPWPLRVSALFLAGWLPLVAVAQRHPVSSEHPRLLGTRAELQTLARERAEDYRRVAAVARQPRVEALAAVVSQALVAAIEGDRALARQAIERVLPLIDGPIRAGHATFGHDLAQCALAYDLCFDAWTEAERARFHVYFNRTVDANLRSETHVFHNGWYGYKNWGIGLAGYACYHENPRAPAILAALERDYRERAAPALELAGAGGGWAEGYYLHYWLHEWLWFCEVARRCEGVDYLALAPRFFSTRAVASMFEMYPGFGDYRSRRPVPMGDGGGRTFGGDRDKALAARRILVNRYRDDPAHQAVHAFNERTPRSAVGNLAYLDFLWRDPSVPRGDLAGFRRSHLSPGPGHVYARSSWDEEATYFFFKCSDRFTAHQHLDAGHFNLYRRTELAGDGGHYDGFGSPHDVNYHLRTIAHSTLLIHDPAERWPGIRAGRVTGNDGGQHHAWPHHNGGVADPAEWERERARHDISDLPAFADHGDHLYVAADATRAYAPAKLRHFTRQIVYLRPETFVIFDRVVATRPEFRKTWLLQAMKQPERRGDDLVITNGDGRLFVQTLLPARADLRLATGADLYRYDGQAFPPEKLTGPAPECRVEISPTVPAEEDLFLHVLTTADAATPAVPRGRVTVRGTRVQLELGGWQLEFRTDALGGEIRQGERRVPFPSDLPSAAAETTSSLR